MLPESICPASWKETFPYYKRGLGTARTANSSAPNAKCCREVVVVRERTRRKSEPASWSLSWVKFTTGRGRLGTFSFAVTPGAVPPTSCRSKKSFSIWKDNSGSWRCWCAPAKVREQLNTRPNFFRLWFRRPASLALKSGYCSILQLKEAFMLNKGMQTQRPEKTAGEGKVVHGFQISG